MIGRSAARLALAGLVGAAILGGGRADAYVRTLTDMNKPMYWPSPCIFLTAYIGDPPKNMVAGQFMAAARGAAAVWSRDALSCTGMSITIDSTSGSEDSVQYDHKNRVMFRRKS